MYGIARESAGTDVVSALFSALGGYGVNSLAKAGMPGTALITDAVLGVGGLTIKHHFDDRPYVHETLEALGYGGFWGMGAWAADATTTFGNHGPGSAPFWQPHTTTTGSSGAVRARVEAARRRAAQLVPTGGGFAPSLAPSFPSDQTEY